MDGTGIGGICQTRVRVVRADTDGVERCARADKRCYH